MPTIQLKLTDEEFEDLLSTAGEATGIKAVRYIVSQYPQALNNIYKLESKVYNLEAEIDSLKYYINDFSVCLSHFAKVSKEYQKEQD